MFFLLMITSAAVLQKTKQQLEQETLKNIALQAELKDYDETFKRLQLLESRLMQRAGYSETPTKQQLDELFSRLQEVKSRADLREINASLQADLSALKDIKRLAEALEIRGIEEKSLPLIMTQLLQQVEKSRNEKQLLQGRVAYLQNKLKGSGLDHPPCWADPQTGVVEYLYSMTLYENKITIAAAWPAHRKADLRLIPGAENLAGQSITQQQLQHKVAPIFAWSKEHACRHFVRIIDDQKTSKEAFKRKMLAVEAYFYKYLQR